MLKKDYNCENNTIKPHTIAVQVHCYYKKWFYSSLLRKYFTFLLFFSFFQERIMKDVWLACMKLLLFTTSLLVLPTEVVQSESQEMLLRISVATLRIVDLLPTAILTRSVTFLSRLAAWMNKTSNKIEKCHSSPFLTIIFGFFQLWKKCH